MEKYCRAGQVTEYEACLMHVGYLRLRTHTHNMYLLRFHCSNGSKNAPPYYIIRTMVVLLQIKRSVHLGGLSGFRGPPKRTV
jgi:hypothetical protein